MDGLDSFLQSVAYKFPKGYPDMDDPKDKKMLFEMVSLLTEEESENKSSTNVDEIKSLIDLIKDDKEALSKIKKFINNRPIEKNFFSDMETQSTITPSTIDAGDAPKKLFDYLSDSDDLADFAKYKKPSFSSMGKQGTILGFFKNSGISDNSLTKIFRLDGKEGGRGVGKGEIGLAFLLDDVKMAETGAGDLDWSGKSLEVKASGARLGKRDNKMENFNNTALGKLATKYDKSDQYLKSLIPNLADEEGINKDELLNAVIEFENVAHPLGDAEKYFTKDILTKPASLRKAFTKNLILNYSKSQDIDHFIFINTTNQSVGKYVSFTPGEADALVDNETLRTNNIATYQLDPAISKP